MRRALLALLAILVALPLLAVAAAAWFLSGDGLQQRLADQVQRATGRTLTVAGPVTLAWSFNPTIALTDVSLANPPGFPSPQMAHVDRLEARLALAPLLQRRLSVDRITVTTPTIRLERNAAGQPNWDFTPPPRPATMPAPPSQPGAPRLQLAIGSIDVIDATLTWGARSLTAPHLTYDPVAHHLSGTLASAGTTLALSGTAGPLDAAPYPIDLRLVGPAATATLAGTSAVATLTVNAADLAALSPLAGRKLPSLRNIAFSAALPGPGSIRLATGGMTSGRFALGTTTLTAPALTAPATLAATATIGALPLTITGQVGSLAALGRGSTDLQLRLEAPNFQLTANGTASPSGAATFRLTTASPDLAALATPTGLSLPALHALAATGTLSLQPGTATLTELQATSTEADLAGALTLTTTGRPFLRGTLSSNHLELPLLVAPTVAQPPPGPSAPVPATPTPTPARLIPDTPLPFAPLRDADADLHVAVATMHVAGTTLTDLQTHATLFDGRLKLDPLALAIGPTTARATLDVNAAASPPALHATVDAPGLDLAPGTLDVRADLTANGSTPHALASTLSGHAGLALVDGRIDNAVLARLAAGSLGAAGIMLEEAGTTTIRCAALHADVAAGRVQLSALTLDTARLALDGTGEVDLGPETLDLHVRPQLRLGGGLRVPLRIHGTLAAPKAQLDPGALASGRVGIILGGAPPPDACGPSLAAARDGQPGPAAAPPPPTHTKPADFLRGLLR